MNSPYSQQYKTPSRLDKISDVKITNPSTGDILTANNKVYSNSVKVYNDTKNCYISNKGDQSINIGNNLPVCIDQTCVNIGNDIGIAGYGTKNVCIGNGAGAYNLGSGCVALGFQACHSNSSQKDNRVSIGYQAGYSNQGESCIAIGYKAGYLNQHDNTIILSSDNAELNSTQANSLFVKRIRNVNNGRGVNGMLYYNPSTYEITYSTT